MKSINDSSKKFKTDSENDFDEQPISIPEFIDNVSFDVKSTNIRKSKISLDKNKFNNKKINTAKKKPKKRRNMNICTKPKKNNFLYNNKKFEIKNNMVFINLKNK